MPTSQLDQYDPSPANLKRLFGIYWSGSGWHPAPRQASAADRTALLSARLVLPPAGELSHDELVRQVRELAAGIQLRAVADAFLASMGARRLDLRSALGSYAVARHLPEHGFRPAPGEGRCEICGLYSTAVQEGDDLNVLAFERFKWGGVRRDDLVYVAFDLEQFGRAPKLTPTRADAEILERVVQLLASATDVTASKASSLLSRTVLGNKAERDVMLEILGVADVLASPGHPGFLQRWVSWSEREVPPRRFADLSYPLCWWTGADGVDPTVLRQLFPSVSAN